jgi:hypothetical protein
MAASSGIQIINDGASLKIISSNGIARLVAKKHIKEIIVIKTTIIKLDLGRGALHNIFINHPEVTIPLLGTPEELRDAINDMLLAETGLATEQHQLEEISELQTIKGSVNEIKLFQEPLLVDESNPLTIYKGFAVPGSAQNAAVWAIQRATISGDITIFQWAGGNRNFDKIWGNRTELSYS